MALCIRWSFWNVGWPNTKVAAPVLKLVGRFQPVLVADEPEYGANTLFWCFKGRRMQPSRGLPCA